MSNHSKPQFGASTSTICSANDPMRNSDSSGAPLSNSERQHIRAAALISARISVDRTSAIIRQVEALEGHHRSQEEDHVQQELRKAEEYIQEALEAIERARLFQTPEEANRRRYEMLHNWADPYESLFEGSDSERPFIQVVERNGREADLKKGKGRAKECFEVKARK